MGLHELLPLGCELSQELANHLGPEDDFRITPVPGTVRVCGYSKLPPQLNMLRAVELHIDEQGVVQAIRFLGFVSADSAIHVLQEAFPGSRWPEIRPGQFFEPQRKLLLVTSPDDSVREGVLATVLTANSVRAIQIAGQR